jgi:hypothetical protein
MAVFSRAYDGANRLTSTLRTIGAGQVGDGTSYSYDNANRVGTIVHYYRHTFQSGYVNSPLATYVYGYDSGNRVTTEQDAEGTATFLMTMPTR